MKRDNSKAAVEQRREVRREQLQSELLRILPLLKRHPGVKCVILFGSLARGETRAHSDLDLVILQETPKRFVERIDEIYGLLKPSVATDILVYTPSEWNRLTLTRPFLRAAKCDGKILYESQAA